MEAEFSFYGNGSWKAYSSNDSELKNEPREILFVADKELSIRTHKHYMLSRLLQMFEYKNLPDTIPAEMLELGLLLNGIMFVTKVKGELYALIGSPGGEPDPYYRPTRYVVANPALKYSDNLDLWKDGVLMRNDKLWTGLSPLINKYAATLAENEITIRTADIMLRIVAMLTSPDDSTKAAADEYLRRIQQGKLGVAAENRFFDGIKMQSPPSNNGSYLTQFIELEQYMKASFYNEVGMQANYNMKRENIGSGETAMNQNATLPLCDQMLEVRQEDVKKVNEMFGTDISVDFASAWKLNAEEMKLSLANLENPVSQLEKGDGDADEGNATEDADTAQGSDEGAPGAPSPDEPRESADGQTNGDSDEGVVVDEEDTTDDSDESSESEPNSGDETSGDSSATESLEVSQLTVDVEVKVTEGGEEDATDDESDRDNDTGSEGDERMGDDISSK